MDVFRTIIVPADLVEEARLEAAKHEGGEGMFTTPLSPTGHGPATHYVSSGFVPPVELGEDMVDVSEEPPFEAMARLGLQMITEDAPAPLPVKGRRK